MAKVKSKKCIVVYDDEAGICSAFGWDDDCEGAIGNSTPVVVFQDREAARRAIRVSVRFAELCQAQGKSGNADFLPPCVKSVKIVPVVEAE